MRLFLASYRLGDHQDRFLEFVGTPGRVAVIGNAADSWPAAARASALVSDVTPLRKLGFEPDEVDLRDFVGRPEALAATLSGFDLLWVRGGNTFVLRAQFARSGADREVPRLLKSESIAYAGYSAGACLVTPTLLGVEEADDPDEVMPTCDIEPVWDGLGLVDHAIVPHWRSAGLDDGAAGRSARRLLDAGVPHWLLTDQQAVLVDGTSVELL